METDDEIDLSLLAMGKRILKNLDGEDRDDLIDELNQTVSRFIRAVRNHKKQNATPAPIPAPGPSTAASTTTLVAQSVPVDNGLRPMPPLQRMVHIAEGVIHE